MFILQDYLVHYVRRHSWGKTLSVKFSLKNYWVLVTCVLVWAGILHIIWHTNWGPVEISDLLLQSIFKRHIKTSSGFFSICIIWRKCIGKIRRGREEEEEEWYKGGLGESMNKVNETCVSKSKLTEPKLSLNIHGSNILNHTDTLCSHQQAPLPNRARKQTMKQTEPEKVTRVFIQNRVRKQRKQ